MARQADTAPEGNLRMRRALAEHFARSGFAADGGYGSRWVKFKIGPIPLIAPNFDARRATVRYHDIHHVLTGYRTDWAGEMEISAWEVASGCAHHWVAWFLDLAALGVGAFVHPRRTFHAWCRGRRSRNFYRAPYEPLLEEKVSALRAQLGLSHSSDAPATMSDWASYVWWVTLGLGVAVVQVAPLAGIVWLVIRS